MSNNKPALSPEPYMMQSQNREALYEAQQAKVEPIPPFIPPYMLDNEAQCSYLHRQFNKLVAHYNTHVVARLNTPQKKDG